MDRKRCCLMIAVITAAVGWQSSAWAQQNRATTDKALSLRLTTSQDNGGEAAMSRETWEIDGPVNLRSADPEPPGEMVIKHNFEWSTTKSGGSDDFEYEFEFEWGVIEDHEFIFEVPFEVGEGRVDGNGDITLGWHWRIWKETDSQPAFAMRNYVRIPTGIDSSGVDYTWKGLFTKTLVEGQTRLHVNPFAKSVNGDNEPDARPFQWGVAIGVDHWLRDDLLFIADYTYESGEMEHTRDNHTAEVGVDWKFADHQTLGLAAEAGLDGDTHGTSFGAKISYITSFGG